MSAFLFTPAAVGLSRDLQAKLQELVQGFKSYDSKGRQDGWQNLAELKKTLAARNVDYPFFNTLFGPSVFMELQRFIGVDVSPPLIK